MSLEQKQRDLNRLANISIFAWCVIPPNEESGGRWSIYKSFQCGNPHEMIGQGITIREALDDAEATQALISNINIEIALRTGAIVQ